MFHLFFTFFAFLNRVLLRKAGAVASRGSFMALVVAFLGTLIFKVFDFLALGLAVYSISNVFIDMGVAKVQYHLDLISSDGTFVQSQVLIDFIYTLKIPQALSIVFSALTAAFTYLSYRVLVEGRRLVKNNN